VHRADFILSSRLSILARFPEEKSICKKNLWEVHFSNSRPNCRYGPGISFPGRGCLTFLVTFVLNRRRDPDILSASSLTCRYRYIGSAPVDGETKSILYPCARENRGCIYFHVAAISLVWNAQLFRRTKLYVGCSVSLDKKPFSIISEKLFSFLSITLLCEDKWK